MPFLEQGFEVRSLRTAERSPTGCEVKDDILFALVIGE
jgi:hypothetical protein